MRMLHPVMPFVTEEVWQKLPHSGESIMASTWPHVQDQIIDEDSEKDMELVIGTVTAVRNMRSVWHIDSSRALDIMIKSKNEKARKALLKNTEYIKRLAKIKDLKVERALKKPKHSATAIVRDTEIFAPLEGVIDFDKERKNLTKKFEEIERVLKGIKEKLKNMAFLSKAPKEVVAGEKDRAKGLTAVRDRLKKNLEDLE